MTKPLPRPANFQELAQRISILAVLKEVTRRNLASNLKRFSEIVGRPSDLIPCDAALVRQLMATASPAAYDVAPGNWRQIRSGVWRSFELGGFQVLRGTGIELNGELAELLENVPKHPEQTELTPLLKFLIENNLSPWELTQSQVPAFRDWLKPRYTRVNWARAMKKAIKRWNRCQIFYGERWPQAPLAPEYVNRDWALPWSGMPRLEIAVDAHLDELRRPRKRRHGGSRKVLNEPTIQARKGYLRRIGSAIYLSTGVMPETLEDITNPDLVEPGVDHIMDEILDAETSGNIYQMLRHVNATARHHVKRSAKEIEELKQIRRSVAPPKGPAEKNRKLLEKFRNPALRDKFLEAPGRVLDRLRRKKVLGTPDLIEGMLAFLAVLLTKHPMRISEAMALKYGETFYDHGSGLNRQVIIDIPGDLTKTGIPRHAKLGARLVVLLDFYRETILNRVVPAGSPFLFPSSTAGPRSGDHLSRQLAKRTSRHVVRMTAHQFRHVVGYLYLLENPGCFETVRVFLGHRSVKTTIEFYVFMLEDDANASLDQTIDKLLEKARRKLRRPRGK